jgi:DNA replication protein DnaC
MEDIPMQQTLEQLKQLRLTGFIEALAEQRKKPLYQELSFDERFALLVERECLRQHNQRLQRRLQQAQLFMGATLDVIDFEVQRGLNKALFLQWAQGHWLPQRLNLMIVGPTGTGKTLLSCALAQHLCTQGYTVRYCKTAELICQIKFARVDGSFPKLRKQLASFDLLMLDEWLREQMSTHDATELLDLLDERYRRSSCIFATQLPVNQWHQKIDDPTLADAILDHIVHDSIRLNLKGESMRKLTSPIQNHLKEANDEQTIPANDNHCSLITTLTLQVALMTCKHTIITCLSSAPEPLVVRGCRSRCNWCRSHENRQSSSN